MSSEDNETVDYHDEGDSEDEIDDSVITYTIPCEFCNNQISIENYEAHANRCLDTRNLMNSIVMNTLNYEREREIETVQNVETAQTAQTVQDNNELFNIEPNNYHNSNYQNINHDPVYDNLSTLFESSIESNLPEQPQPRLQDYPITNVNVMSNLMLDVTPSLISESSDDDMPGLANSGDDSSSDEYDDFDNERTVEMSSLPILNERNSYIQRRDNNLNRDNDLDYVYNIRNRMRDSLRDNNLDNLIINLITQSSGQSGAYNIDFNSLLKPILDFNKISIILSEINNDLKDDENDSIECPICYEKLDEINNDNKDNSAVELLCKHKFCKNCIKKWLEKNDECPICKSNLREMLYNIENENKENENKENENKENENKENENDNIEIIYTTDEIPETID